MVDGNHYHGCINGCVITLTPMMSSLMLRPTAKQVNRWLLRPIEKLDWLDNVYGYYQLDLRHRTITTVSLFCLHFTLTPVFMPESPIGTGVYAAQDNSRIAATGIIYNTVLKSPELLLRNCMPFGEKNILK